jgi:hypothetical protein
MSYRAFPFVLSISLFAAGCGPSRIIGDDDESPDMCSPDSPGCDDTPGPTPRRDLGGSEIVGVCSADLQSVLDRNGSVIKRCPPDQGCANGRCVAACTAASQSSGSIGCDFFAPDPPFYSNGQNSTYDGTCYAVFVANTWSRHAKITVTRGGQTFDMTKFGYTPTGILPNITYTPLPAEGVPPDEVAVLFLSHKPGAKHGLGTPLTCPAAPAILSDAAVSGSGKGAAFHIVSDTPITAYDILPFGGAQSYLPSASLLFPSNAWGTNYYAVAPRTDGGGSLWMMLVGSADGTKVTLAPPRNLPGGGGLGNAPANMSTSFTINAGEILPWIGADPTSTVIQATSPIGVFTGSTYLRVSSQTSGGGGQDSAHQQIPQIKALGSEYVGAGIVTRMKNGQQESIPYRLLGIVDGTTLSYDPAQPAGAPTMLKAGQVVEFESRTPFVIKSQDADHPFGLTHYMPGTFSGTVSGCGPANTGGCSLGDEDWVNILAPEQFLQRYVFFTDPTYGTTNLVVTRVAGPSGFSDVTIKCLGSPITGWKNVDNAGKYQVAYVDLVRGAKPIIDKCGGSRQEASSDGKFGVTVWGTDYYASYGYPAGGNFGSINNVVVIP